MRTSHYLGDHTALTTTKFGDKIYVDTRDTSLAPHLLVEGDWEPWVSNAFRATMSRFHGARVIDVGANFGWYTLLAHRCGASRVVAIEPNQRLFRLLWDSVAVNGYSPKTSARRVACVAEATDDLFLEFTWREAGGGRLTAAPPDRSSEYEHVQGLPLDNILQAEIPITTPSIVKIDVEGREVDVLRGASTLLAERPVLFVEHHQDNTRDLWELLGERYVIKHAEHTGHAGAPLTIETAERIGEAETLICEPKP